MKYEAYIRVVGTQEIVNALHEHLRWEGSICFRPRSVTAEVGDRWQWCTPKVALASGQEHEGIESLLVSCKSRGLGEAIAARRAAIRLSSLVVVCRHGEDDDGGRGLYLGPKAIAIMAEIGLDLDYDLSRSSTA